MSTTNVLKTLEAEQSHRASGKHILYTPYVATPSGAYEGSHPQSRVMCTQWEGLNGRSGMFATNLGVLLRRARNYEYQWSGLHLGTFVTLQEFQMEHTPPTSCSWPENKTCASSVLPFPLELEMGVGTSGYHSVLLQVACLLEGF